MKKVQTLGDVKGTLLYLGRCSKCHVQFMSTRERVVRLPNLLLVHAECA